MDLNKVRGQVKERSIPIKSLSRGWPTYMDGLPVSVYSRDMQIKKLCWLHILLLAAVYKVRVGIVFLTILL